MAAMTGSLGRGSVNGWTRKGARACQRCDRGISPVWIGSPGLALINLLASVWSMSAAPG